MGRILRRLPFRYCEPAFFGGLLDDPLLFLRIRPEGRALLFDCGQIAHLAKRVVKPIAAVFITHAHMDHVMGVPTLVRHHHASPLPLDLYGPPAIAERIAHLLQGFDWNLCEPTWFTLRVHEIYHDRILHYSFPGPEGFARHFDGEDARTNLVIWHSRYVTVEAMLLDHRIASLAFRVSERPPFSVSMLRMEGLGVVPGDWIRDLKSRIWKGNDEVDIMVPYRDGEGVRKVREDDPGGLYEQIRGEQQSASVGYVTDVGWTPDNVQRMEGFLVGLTLLCAECTFLRSDVEKARASYHLCSDDLNDLLARLAPKFLLPIHLSKSYLRHAVDLYQELSPPAGTTVIRMPNHIVPEPVTVEDVKKWLRTDAGSVASGSGGREQ
jgi:ribonuclease Z